MTTSPAFANEYARVSSPNLRTPFAPSTSAVSFTDVVFAFSSSVNTLPGEVCTSSGRTFSFTSLTPKSVSADDTSSRGFCRLSVCCRFSSMGPANSTSMKSPAAKSRQRPIGSSISAR